MHDDHTHYRAPRARLLRQRSTDPERLLWTQLRGRRFGGFKFRRQHPVGPYFADFCCLELKLIIELDGIGHLDRARYDAERDVFLRSRGFEVLRIENVHVVSALPAVLETLWEVVLRLSGEGLEPF